MCLVATEKAGNRLREIRERLRFTQKEFAAVLGVDRARYKNWEYGHSAPPHDLMELAERQLPDAPVSEVGPFLQVRTMPMVKVPVVGHVSAGPGADPHEIQDDVYVPAHMAPGPGLCAYVAEGDSMMPWIHPGDIVIIRPHQTERLGFAFLVERADGTSSLKMLGHDGTDWELRSLNPKYEPERQPARLVGYVIGIYRLSGTTEYTMLDANGLRPG
jgi:SOS-response transcriptional repressor LexA